MKTFADRRRGFWLAGIAILVLGFLAAALLLPSTSDPMRGIGPAVHVPKMQNVPPDNDRVKLEVEEGKKEP
jgi:hypothetical protein